jgi:hypothetical protein
VLSRPSLDVIAGAILGGISATALFVLSLLYLLRRNCRKKARKISFDIVPLRRFLPGRTESSITDPTTTGRGDSIVFPDLHRKKGQDRPFSEGISSGHPYILPLYSTHSPTRLSSALESSALSTSPIPEQ